MGCWGDPSLRLKNGSAQDDAVFFDDRFLDDRDACLVLDSWLNRRAYPRPMPTYSNPRARRRVESSRFLVSTMTGFLSRCLMRSKSRARNSGHTVPTTSASEPSAAA